MKILVITVSDRAYKCVYEDKSGKAIVNILNRELLNLSMDNNFIDKVIIPDDYDMILDTLNQNKDIFDIIITTGGTGISSRDVTPEATKDFCEKEVMGVSEYLRSESIKETIFATLSRGYCGIKGRVFVVNFPGSENGAIFCTKLIIPLLQHIVKMLNNEGH